MGFVVEYFELDVPDECTEQLNSIVLSGELGVYISGLIIKDLLSTAEQPNQTNVPALTNLGETDGRMALKALLKEALLEVADESPGTTFVRTSRDATRAETEPVIDVDLEDIERKPVDIKPGEGSKGLLNKFKKMRKG